MHFSHIVDTYNFVMSKWVYGLVKKKKSQLNWPPRQRGYWSPVESQFIPHAKLNWEKVP